MKLKTLLNEDTPYYAIGGRTLKSTTFLGKKVSVGDRLTFTKDFYAGEYHSWSIEIPKGQTIVVDKIYEVPYDEYSGEDLVIVFDISTLDKDILNHLQRDLTDDMFNEINSNKIDLHRLSKKWMKEQGVPNGNPWIGEPKGEFEINKETSDVPHNKDKKTIKTVYDYFINIVWASFNEAFEGLKNLDRPKWAITDIQCDKLERIYYAIVSANLIQYKVPSEVVIKDIRGFKGLELTRYRDQDVYHLIQYLQKTNLKEVQWTARQVMNHLKKYKDAKIYLRDKYGYYSDIIRPETLLGRLNARTYNYGYGSMSTTVIEKVTLSKDKDGNLYLSRHAEVWD